MCIQIWQKDYNGSRVLWGFVNNLPDAIGVVQIMADGMRDGWQTGFEVVIGDSHIEMTDFMQMHDIKKRSFDERIGYKK